MDVPLNDRTMDEYRRPTGWLLVIWPIATLVPWLTLTSAFEYPDILREPLPYVLEQYVAGGAIIPGSYFGMALGFLLLAPLAVLWHRVLKRPGTWYLDVATVLAVLSAVFGAIGFLRWVFAMPVLAAALQAPGATVHTQQTVALVFDVLNQWAGAGIGEVMSYICLGVWAILSAVAMDRAGTFPKWLVWLWGISGLGVLYGTTEWVGLPAAAAVNATAGMVAMLAIFIAGVVLLRQRGG
jgi:hypothetical protein